jgi:uracil-DNA glycosylase family 4
MGCLSPVLKSKIEKCEVLIVCDQPDSKADFEDQPFAGALGSLIESLLEKAHLSGHCKTYAVKCASDKKYTTLNVSSIDACRVYLKEDIRLSQPNYILCMGDSALRAVTKRSGIKNNRGKELQALPELNTNAKVFCTYSLEYLARNATLARTVVSDIGRCKTQTTDTNVPWKIWEGEDIDGDVLAYDIEAVDTEGAFTSYATQVAICNEEICYVTMDVKAIFNKLGSKRFVGHNSFHYDNPVLRKQEIHIQDYHDTMYMAFFMDETQPRGLEALAVKYLGVPGWKEAFHAKLGSDEFSFYNARDAWYTMQLFQLFRKELSKDKRFSLIEGLIYPVRRVFDEMSVRGVCLDRQSIMGTKAEVATELKKLKYRVGYQMEELLGFDKKINPNSTRQVAEVLDKLGLWYPLTENGNPHVSKDILEAHRATPFISELLEYREQAKQLSTYIKPYEKLANEGDGRAHPEYKMISVDTGRTSASRPNVQNLDRSLKKFFTAPPGKVLLLVDYSAIEFRVASWLAQEETVLSRFRENPNWDPHAFFAAMFYDKEEKDVTDAERQIAKSANFSQLYIGTGFTLFEYAKKQGVHIPLHQCERLHDTWHSVFPGFNRYYLSQKQKLLSAGEIQCPTGFIRHFGSPDLLRVNYGSTFFGKLRQGVNVPVQNLSTHIAFLAMKRLAEFNFPMVLFVHDSIGFELDDDHTLPEIVKHIEKVMCRWPIQALKSEYDIDFTIPLSVKSEIKRSA